MDFVAMASQFAKYTTKELSRATWRGLCATVLTKERLEPLLVCTFSPPTRLATGEMAANTRRTGVRNRRQQKALVDKGCSHGILVYLDSEPVGWCQYGPGEELTRIDTGANYRGLAPENQKARLWRITCFVVDKKYRRRGVAGVALKAALASIKKQGGGLVEAYPVANWEGGSFGNMSTHGTVSMFAKQGFKKIAAYGNTNVVMRKRV